MGVSSALDEHARHGGPVLGLETQRLAEGIMLEAATDTIDRSTSE